MKGKTANERARRYANRAHGTRYESAEQAMCADGEQDALDLPDRAWYETYKAGLRQARKESGE